MSHPTERELLALIAGELSADEARPIADHLDACPACREVAEKLTEVPRDLWASLVVAVEGADLPGPSVPTIPGYSGLREIARGGSGLIYCATENATGRLVALKVLRGGALASPSEHDWFRSEALAAARLRHPNITTVLSVGDSHELPYYAMEYLPGGSLADLLAGTPIAPQEAASIVEAIAGAIQHAHESGVIHRDIKPGNILLDRPAGGTQIGTPKVSDFGMAKNVDASHPTTPSDAVMGTPSYMAPEQAFGKSRDVGPSADIYSLGALLYELLTGRPPFRGASPYETVLLVCNGEPVPPRQLRPAIPRDLETVCLKCLEKEPGRRYATASALAADLSAFRHGRPVSARPVGRVGHFTRWVRRNPVVAALSGLSIALLVALLAITTVSWRRAEAQRAALAESNRKVEGQRKQLLEGFVFTGEITSRMLRTPGLLTELDKQAILSGPLVFEKILDVPESPDDEHKVAYAVLQFCDTLQRSGESERSKPASARAVATLRRLSEAHPERSEYAYHYAQGCMQIAGYAMADGPANEVIRYHEEAVRVAKDLVRRFPDINAFPADLAIFEGNLAQDYIDRGRDKEAEPLLKRAVEANRKFVAIYPTDPDRYQYFHLACWRYSAFMHRVYNDQQTLWDLARERMRLCDRARDLPDWHLISGYLFLGWELPILDQAGRSTEADQIVAHRVADLEAITARDPMLPKVRFNLAEWLETQGQRRWSKDPEAATRSFRKAIAIYGSPNQDLDKVSSTYRLANLLLHCPATSLRDPARAVGVARTLPDDFSLRRCILGSALAENGEYDEARKELERYLAEAKPAADVESRKVAISYLDLCRKKLNDPK